MHQIRPQSAPYHPVPHEHPPHRTAGNALIFACSGPGAGRPWCGRARRLSIRWTVSRRDGSRVACPSLCDPNSPTTSPRGVPSEQRGPSVPRKYSPGLSQTMGSRIPRIASPHTSGVAPGPAGAGVAPGSLCPPSSRIRLLGDARPSRRHCQVNPWPCCGFPHSKLRFPGLISLCATTNLPIPCAIFPTFPLSFFGC